MSEKKISGRLEDGRCFVNVNFGRITPEGVWFNHGNPLKPEPPLRAALDLISPGPVLPLALARKLGLAERPGPVRVEFYVEDGRDIVARGVADALVVAGNNPPTLGLAQLMEWQLNYNGPAGTFEVLFPPMPKPQART